MMFTRMSTVAAAGALIVMACLIPPRTDAQGIARRISTVREGKVRMTFAARPDICGYGDGISTGYRRDSNNRTSWTPGHSEDVIYDNDCSEGPVRVVVTMSGGSANRIKTYVGGQWRSATGVTDFGNVSVKDATDYLLGVANTQSGKTAGEAIFPVTLADSIDLTRALAPIAENESRPGEVRKQALFWLGQGGAPMEKLTALYSRMSDREMKDQMIFVFSQRRERPAIDKLMDIAKNDPDREARRKALFWLGQSRDSRVSAFLSDIINR